MTVMKSGKSDRLIRFIMVSISIFLALIFTELLLRAGVIANPTERRYKIDKIGKPPLRKILILGDSFLEKGGPGNFLYDPLVRDLKNDGGIEILNPARGGNGPLDYLVQAKTGIRRLHPEWIILFYYAGNDLTDVQYRHAAAKPWLVFLKSKIKQLYLYDPLERGLGRLSSLFSSPRTQPAGEDQPVPLNPYLIDMARRYPDYLLDNLLMETKENAIAMNQIRTAMSEIHRRSEQTGAKLVIVILPQNLQVNGSLFNFYERIGFKINSALLHSTKPQEFMAQFCREEGIPCLDLLPYLKGVENKGFYRDNDDHFTAEGALKAESFVFPFIHNELTKKVPAI